MVKVADADPLDWERIIAVNLTGTFHGCAAALAVMGRSGGGRIVNIGSLSGQVGGTALHPRRPYRRVQGGRARADQDLRARRRQVRRLLQRRGALGDRRAMASQLSERQREQLARANPLRRLARMPEVVDAVRYLASDARATPMA